jgi:hypothetical protein
MKNEKLEALDDEAQEYAGRVAGNDEDSNYNEWFNVYKAKFAELIVKECANAADMAYDGHCKYPGDYVGEQMGYGEEHGITAWRLA